MDIEDERIFALSQLVFGLPRPFTEYLSANTRAPNKQGFHDTKIKGNLGRLFVTGNDHFNCNNWIAGSPNADDVVRDPIHNCESNDAYIGSLTNDNQLYFGTKTNEAHCFPEFFAPGRGEAREDSEYLLLNALGFALTEHNVSCGVAYLFTERVPCDSCTHVINQFLDAHPDFKLEIFYLFDSTRRSHAMFFKECKHETRVSMFFCQLTRTSINFVKVDVHTPILKFAGDYSAAGGSSTAIHVVARIKPAIR